MHPNRNQVYIEKTKLNIIGTCVEKHSLGSPVREKHNMRLISAKNGTNADSISEDFVVPRSGSLGLAWGPPLFSLLLVGWGWGHYLLWVG